MWKLGCQEPNPIDNTISNTIGNSIGNTIGNLIGNSIGDRINNTIGKSKKHMTLTHPCLRSNFGSSLLLTC